MGFFSSIGKAVGGALGKVGNAVLGSAGSLLGAGISTGGDIIANNQNADLQREFAQHGIQWKVEDAKRAGVHPLFALGANTVQASPSYVSSGSHWANAGQDLSRSIKAGQSSGERLANELLESQIDGQKIDNQMKIQEMSSRAARNMSAQLPPPFPEQDNPGFDRGDLLDYSHATDRYGNEIVVPSDDMLRVLEADPLQIPSWHLRNTLPHAWDKTVRAFKGYIDNYRDRGMF